MTLRERIEEALGAAALRHFGDPVKIENLRPVSGGAVGETWFFDAVQGGQRRELILRGSRPGREGSHLLTRTSEAQLQQRALEAGVPVAPVPFILEERDGIGAGYVMERIPGETIARKILRDEPYREARTRMACRCGEILARIHSMDPARLPPLQKMPAGEQIQQFRQIYLAFGEDLPVFDFAFRWLADHAPGESELRLVHGDFRNGNFIVGPEGIRAVLDWELAHLGDPLEDLGWLCVNSWRFGNLDEPVGGFGQREDLFRGYESAGGRKIDPDTVHFWEVFGTLKWGIMCLIQGFTHLSGAKRSVELAAIGRRPSETEIDLLNLLT